METVTCGAEIGAAIMMKGLGLAALLGAAALLVAVWDWAADNRAERRRDDRAVK